MQETVLERLIKTLAKLPGLGPRSARRAALHLVKNKETQLKQLSDLLLRCHAEMQVCAVCGNIDTVSPCYICQDERRSDSSICIVEEVADLWALERGGVFKGKYHVLGGTLSAIEARGPEELGLGKLLMRIKTDNVEEIILATNVTVEGQTTAHYITEQARPLGVKISRLAQGIPIGGELDYMDEGTLSAAMKARLVVG